MLPVDRAQHHTDGFFQDISTAISNRLVKKTQRVTQTAVRRPRQHRQSRYFSLDLFSFADMREAVLYQLRCQAFQIELQASRQNGHRKFLGIGGGQQKLDVRRRFFKRLQQCVERTLRQHVHFVDQIDLIATACRCVLHVVQEVARIFDFGPRCRVHFDQIDEAAFVDLHAGRTFPARTRSNTCLTVQRLGKNARNRRLANATCSGKQVGVVQPPAFKSIGQCLQNMLLPHRLRKVFRAPFSGENEITHIC